MTSRRLLDGLFVTAGLFLCACSEVATEESGIEGNYRLIYRELPDGTRQMPPDVVGMMTFAKGYRNFNIYVKDTEGNASSVGYIATYELTDEGYSENSLYRFINDEVAGEGLRYDLAPQSGTSPVTRDEGRIEFDLPLRDEPKLVFEGDKMTATEEGVFVDYWERVK